MNKKRLAIFISGRGSNMESLLRACEAPDYPADPALVLSNRPSAKGLEIAAARGIPTIAIDHKTFNGDICKSSTFNLLTRQILTR